MNYAPSVGVKFNEDGSVRHFPGNTFLCHVDKESPVLKQVIWAQQQLKAMDCAKNYAFLPESSMHMTVFEGLCDQIRDESVWSSKLTSDVSLEDATEQFMTWLNEAQATPKFKMVFDHVYNSRNGGTVLRIKPANQETLDAIKACRENLSELTGIRHPVHDSYHFHITLSYKVIHLDEEQERELLDTCARIEQRMNESFGELTHGAVEFCEFKDMFEFRAVKHLPLS
ncbi:DUF1868 domain-containing protein [Vibrio maerlii]|uniref:DUF1868 domain-containing protein n=1 Tax=Vibrio maerlii TaxID=2231648 RepID=UPI000E3DAD90|nr:DUF1868 domain-containing protein [Vibrio maerlii]